MEPRAWTRPPNRCRAERPDLIVILEVMLDVKDIAQLDPEEVIQLWNALGQVDREASIASWSQTEPQAIWAWRQGVLRRAPMSDVAVRPTRGVIRPL